MSALLLVLGIFRMKKKKLEVRGRGKDFLLIMHEGDADYEYLLSIAGVF